MSSKILLTILAAASLMFVAISFVQHSVLNIKQNPYLEIGTAKLEIEIADTDAARAQGLSGRAALAANRGLLFIFDRADYHGFWMKEMNFPIDIIWLDDNWQVIDLTENISPKDFPTTYQPRAPARYILEVNAGFIATHRLIIGAQAILNRVEEWEEIPPRNYPVVDLIYVRKKSSF